MTVKPFLSNFYVLFKMCIIPMYYLKLNISLHYISILIINLMVDVKRTYANYPYFISIMYLYIKCKLFIFLRLTGFINSRLIKYLIGEPFASIVPYTKQYNN